ncbi:MAG: auxin-responsive protein [Gemmataceae bacterium]
MLGWLVRKTIAYFATRQAHRWAAAFREATRRPFQVQQRLLQWIVQRQSATRFGREHGFASIRTLEDYRRQVPILTYEDLEPYIAEVRKGQFDALLADDRVLMFAMTSGTTASRKFIPVTPQYLSDYRRGWTIWGIAAFDDHPQAKLQPILQLVGDWQEFHTEAGIPCGSVSGLTAQMQKRIVRRLYCLPPVTGKIKDAEAKYYVACRLSIHRPVGMICAANPSTLVQIACTMDREKETLLRDLYDGTLSPRYDIPRTVREVLRPWTRRKHKRRVRELEKTLRLCGGHLYPIAVWPTLQLLGNWTGGTVRAYLKLYPRYFGTTPVRDLGLIASEGRFSIPLEDGSASGVLEITSHFFEFVPENELNSQRPVVLAAHELEEGKNYFILPTTAFGLYRYNICDLVRVTGFYERTPMIEFLNKGAHFSNITGEKLSEYHVVTAVDRSAQELQLTLTVYSLVPCWDESQPFYGLFVEEGDLENLEQARRLAARVDRALLQLNVEYHAKRQSRRLGSIRVMLLPRGTWTEWDRRRLARTGGTVEQYKHPCLIPDLNVRESLPVLEQIPADEDPVALPAGSQSVA